jgi:hypothetical protein
MQYREDARANGKRAFLPKALYDWESFAQSRKETRNHRESEESETRQNHAGAIQAVEGAGENKQRDREDGPADICGVVLSPEKVEAGGKDAEC